MSKASRLIAGFIVVTTHLALLAGAALLLLSVPTEELIRKPHLQLLGGFWLLLTNYTALKVLMGTKRTRSSLAELLDVFKKAGAAEELRNQLEDKED